MPLGVLRGKLLGSVLPVETSDVVTTFLRIFVTNMIVGCGLVTGANLTRARPAPARIHDCHDPFRSIRRPAWHKFLWHQCRRTACSVSDDCSWRQWSFRDYCLYLGCCGHKRQCGLETAILAKLAFRTGRFTSYLAAESSRMGVCRRRHIAPGGCELPRSHSYTPIGGNTCDCVWALEFNSQDRLSPSSRFGSDGLSPIHSNRLCLEPRASCPNVTIRNKNPYNISLDRTGDAKRDWRDWCMLMTFWGQRKQANPS